MKFGLRNGSCTRLAQRLGAVPGQYCCNLVLEATGPASQVHSGQDNLASTEKLGVILSTPPLNDKARSVTALGRRIEGIESQ